MFNNKTLTSRQYNALIGVMVLYGLIVNAITVALVTPIIEGVSVFVILAVCFACPLIGVCFNMSDKPLLSFIGYNFVAASMGIILAVCLKNASYANILFAMISTAIIVLCMLVAATIKPNLFSKLGTALITTLLIGFVVELISVLLGYTGSIFDYLFICVFSLYIGYDWVKAHDLPKTVDNVIDSAMEIYLDIINLFLRLLSSKSKKD